MAAWLHAQSSSTVTEWESQQIQSSQEKHHIASMIEKLIEVEGVNRKSYYWLDVVQIHSQSRAVKTSPDEIENKRSRSGWSAWPC